MRQISTDQAPPAIGPYSQAIQSGGLVYCSGQIPLDPTTGELASDGIAEQTRQVLQNLSAVLEAAGSSLQQVVKTTVFLADMDDFPTMNVEYERVFAGHKPARATVEVSRLPKEVRVEIECIAEVKRPS